MNFRFSLKRFVDDAETQVYAIYEKDQEAARAAAAKVTRVCFPLIRHRNCHVLHLQCLYLHVLYVPRYIRSPIVAMHMINVYSEQ